MLCRIRFGKIVGGPISESNISSLSVEHTWIWKISRLKILQNKQKELKAFLCKTAVSPKLGYYNVFFFSWSL